MINMVNNQDSSTKQSKSDHIEESGKSTEDKEDVEIFDNESKKSNEQIPDEQNSEP